jgi:predicted PilT family ATPase
MAIFSGGFFIMATTRKKAQNSEVSGKIDKEVKKAVTEAKTKKTDITEAEETSAKKTKSKKTTETKPVAKKTTVKKSVEVFVQYSETEIKTDDLVEKAKEIFVAAGNKKTDAKDVKVYVKPEENMVYFVINQEFNGSFGI